MLTHKVSLTNGIHAVQADGGKVQLCKEGDDGQRKSGLVWMELEYNSLPQHARNREPLSSPRNRDMLNSSLTGVFVTSPGSQCAAELALPAPS